MKKKTLIICGGLLAVIVVVAGTFKYYVQPKYVAPLIGAIEEFLLEDTETLDLLLQEYEKSLIEDGLQGQDADSHKVNEGKVEDVGEKVNTDGATDVAEKDKGEQVIDPKQATTTQPAEKSTDKPVVGGKTIQELQKEVEPGDLKSGLSIASKIDTGHLMSLAKGGITAEDKKAAKSHLESRLTPSEISQLKYFVGKYAHLLK